MQDVHAVAVFGTDVRGSVEGVLDVISFNAAISACVQRRLWQQAVSLLDETARENCCSTQ
eukprot:12425400-Karenia_brevis.AAC.1